MDIFLQNIRPYLKKWTTSILTGRKKPIVFAGVISCMVIAGLVIILTRAATSSVSVEAESGTRQGNVQQCSDSNASGGLALEFGSTNCEITGGTFQSIRVSQPTQSQAISCQGFTFAALDEPLFSAARVEFWLDGSKLGDATKGLGWNLACDPNRVSPTLHNVLAKAYNSSNQLIGTSANVGFGVSSGTFTNPVVNSDCPDPGAYKDGTTYYVVCTTHILPAYRIRKSADLVNWTDTGKHVFTSANKPRWATNDYYWAPELHKVGSKYIVHYSSKNASTGYLCTGAATADNPEGPYADIGRPLVCGNGMSVLDSTYFRDDNGRHYLYWKSDASVSNPNGYMHVQELDASGTSVIGSPVRLFRNTLSWEGILVEGPWVLKRNGQYYMFYSASTFDKPTYAVGVARASSPLGPFTKKGDPILKAGARWKGPGHNSSVLINGTDYMVYHAWEGSTYPGVRKLMIDKIAWANGWPQVGNGTPTEGSQAIPR